MNREGDSEGSAGVSGMDNVEEMEHLLQPQLLNLPPHQFGAPPPQLLQHLFSAWLSLDRSVSLVRSLIDYVKDRNPISVPGSSASASTSESNLLTRSISLDAASPLPPNVGSSANASTSQSSMGSTAISLGVAPNISGYSNISSASSSRYPLALAGDIDRGVIPQFYFPRGRPPTDEFRQQCLNRINNLFSNRPDGLELHEFRRVTKEVCRLPFFVSYALFHKIAPDNDPLVVTRDAFIQYWVNSTMLTMDKATQIFNILKQPEHDYLTEDDFTPVIGELMAFHPGLAFLRQSGNLFIQEAYAATVVYRIFYYVNRSGNGRLTLRELKGSDLVAAMQHADVETDIDEVRRYFSYEHSYVIFWKFMRLDEDNDSHINKMELTRYENQTLSYKILNRIFSQVPRRFRSGIEGKMNYEDFVYFILAEQDKQSEPSLEYWFKCIDLDGNGVLTRNELEYFYNEQICRMKCIDEEKYVPFERILHRISDMIEPEEKDVITLRDVKRSKLSGDFFDILFNFDKFLASDRLKPRRTHEEYLAGQEHMWANLTEWDRYVQREYPELLRENAVGPTEVPYSDTRSQRVPGQSHEAPY